jgi:CheY-like chemotaxis protein
MPGMSGLETLQEMKEKRVIMMITKSEEEYIMEEAIGSKIADYLINRKSKSDFVKLEEKLDHRA